MSTLPPAGTSAEEFFERFVLDAFRANPLAEDAKEIDVMLGVKLDGEGGGEWRFRLHHGDVSVERGSTDDAAFTLIQSVVDWRGALWEGRGGVFGRQSQAMFQPGGGGGASGAPPLSALPQLQMLKGVIRMIVTGGSGGDWALSFKLGPGPIPTEPTTTITIGAEDADAMERGELDPMQAFMSGKILVAGDMTLMMQMQVIGMQAQAAAQAKKA